MSTPNQGSELKTLQDNGRSVLLASNTSHKDHCPLSVQREDMTGFPLSFCPKHFDNSVLPCTPNPCLPLVHSNPQPLGQPGINFCWRWRRQTKISVPPSTLQGLHGVYKIFLTFKINFPLFYMYRHLVCMNACPHVCSTCRGQRMAPDPLELELEMIISHKLGAGNQTVVLWKSTTVEPSLQPLLFLVYTYFKTLQDRPKYILFYQFK